MFDINIAIHKQEQLKQDAIHGLPDKPVKFDEPVQHIDDTEYMVNAEREGIAISNSFRPILHRLRRTYKQGGDTFPSGQKHRSIGRNW